MPFLFVRPAVAALDKVPIVTTTGGDISLPLQKRAFGFSAKGRA